MRGDGPSSNRICMFLSGVRATGWGHSARCRPYGTGRRSGAIDGNVSVDMLPTQGEVWYWAEELAREEDAAVEDARAAEDEAAAEEEAAGEERRRRQRRWRRQRRKR